MVSNSAIYNYNCNKQLQSKSHFYAVSMPINDAKSKNSKKINQMIIREVYVFVEVFNT